MNGYNMSDKGYDVLARILAESGKLNGFYLEYGGTTCAGAVRDKRYFESLEHSPGQGYIRVPVTVAYAKGPVVHLSAMVTRDQIEEDVKDVRFTCLTVVSMGHTKNEDQIIFTTDIDVSLGVTDNAYTTIDATMRIG